TLSLTMDSISLYVNSRMNESDNKNIRRKITSDEWNAVISTLDSLTLPEINSLKSSSMNRATDAAMGASIIITDSKGERYIHSFDEFLPDEKMKGMMNELIRLENNLRGAN